MGTGGCRSLVVSVGEVRRNISVRVSSGFLLEEVPPIVVSDLYRIYVRERGVPEYRLAFRSVVSARRARTFRIYWKSVLVGEFSR